MNGNTKNWLRSSLLATTLSLSVFTASSAMAGGYIGLDGSSLNVENSQDTDLSPKGVRLRLGLPIAPMFDFEVHLGGGSESDTFVADRFTASYLGGFLKGYLPVSRRSAFFGLAGIASVEFNQEIDGRDFSDERSGFSYGVGFETELSNRMDLSADYMRYVQSDGEFSELSAINFGLKLYF